MKYNPDYHSSVVGNLRALFSARYQGTKSKLSDTEIWNIFESNRGFLTGAETDEATVLDMYEREYYPEYSGD